MSILLLPVEKFDSCRCLYGNLEKKVLAFLLSQKNIFSTSYEQPPSVVVSVVQYWTAHVTTVLIEEFS